jgi:hypothetical protein
MGIAADNHERARGHARALAALKPPLCPPTEPVRVNHHAILDHPDAQQHRLRRPAVPALLRLLARLRPDAHSKPRAWRLLHARRLSGRDHHVSRRQLLDRGARRGPRRRPHRHPVRAADPAPPCRQRAGPGAGDARLLVHHRGPLPDDLDRRPLDRAGAGRIASAHSPW